MARSGSTFLALLTGAAIGAGLGMLYAPERGEDTRRKLSDNARRTQDDLNRRYKETSSNLSSKAKQAKSDFEQRLDETLSSASYKADEILSSLEEKLEELKKQNARFQKDRNETGVAGSGPSTGSGKSTGTIPGSGSNRVTGSSTSNSSSTTGTSNKGKDGDVDDSVASKKDNKGGTSGSASGNAVV